MTPSAEALRQLVEALAHYDRWVGSFHASGVPPQIWPKTPFDMVLDAVRVLAAGLVDPPGAQEWQPIEMAPKDGSWFWVKRDKATAPSGIDVSAVRWDDSDGMWFAGTAWWDRFPMAFTHWRQLNDTCQLVLKQECEAQHARADAAEAKIRRLTAELDALRSQALVIFIFAVMVSFASIVL